MPLERLAASRLLVLDPSARSRRLLDESLVEAGVAARELLECSNPQVAQALAAAGRGVAVLSDDPRFDLVPLRVRTLDRSPDPDAAPPPGTAPPRRRRARPPRPRASAPSALERYGEVADVRP